jgi:hypothetical protein
VAYIIAEPCIGTKDTACVDVCRICSDLPLPGIHLQDAVDAADKANEGR